MLQDLRFAFRQLVRQRALSVAAVLTLALGIAASLAVFTLINAALLRPLPYPEPTRIVSLRGQGGGTRGNGTHRDVQFLREHVRTCSPIGAAVGGGGVNVVVQGRPSYVRDQLVSFGFFEALGITPQWGRRFSAEEDAPSPARVALLSERLARGTGVAPETLVGSDIQLGGFTYTVVGILADDQMLRSDPDVYRPLGNDARGAGSNLDMVCRLGADASMATIDGELLALTDEARRRDILRPRMSRAYYAWPRHETQFGSLRPRLLTLLGAVLLVLLVAAGNTTGLLLVRAAGRRREIAVRTALGAAPVRVARTLVTEGMVLAMLAGLIGLAASPLLVRGLLAVAPAFYVNVADFTLDRVVVLAAISLCVLVGIIVSLPPLLEVLRLNLRDTLQEEGRSETGGRRTTWVRQFLVGAETAICAVLLVGALLLVRTFINLVNVPTGVNSEGVITARMAVQGPQYNDGAQLIRFFEEGIARLEQSPSVDLAAVAASLPAEVAINLATRFPDSAQPDAIEAVNWRYVSPHYFELLGIPHVAGRVFTESDRRGAPAVALVNETFARQRYGGIQQALGRRILTHPMSKSIQDPVREVVGVVADTAGFALGEPSRAIMFVPLAQVDAGVLRSVHAFFPPRWIVRSSRDPEGARRALENVVRDLDPAQPFIDITTLDTLMLNSISLQRFYLVVLLAFSVFAVALAAVGIYATYSYAVASRTPEIGVRLALGAAPGRILRGIVLQGLLLGGVATAIGLAMALAASRVLNAMLFNVSTRDPLTYAIVAVTLLATVTVATWVPARRAARVDPLVALRR